MFLAKLNTQAECIWTVSRGVAPAQLMTLGASQPSRVPSLAPRAPSPCPSPGEGPAPHLGSLCPASTSSYTMSSWETFAGSQMQQRQLGKVIPSLALNTVYCRRGWGCCKPPNPKGPRQGERKSLTAPEDGQNSNTRQDAGVCQMCLWAVFFPKDTGGSLWHPPMVGTAGVPIPITEGTTLSLQQAVNAWPAMKLCREPTLPSKIYPNLQNLKTKLPKNKQNPNPQLQHKPILSLQINTATLHDFQMGTMCRADSPLCNTFPSSCMHKFPRARYMQVAYLNLVPKWKTI